MAYRNHPSRYLIVKDRVASPPLAGGQQEAATYAAHIPASSTFFSKPADSFVGGRFPVSRSGGRIYASPSGPSSTFFQSPFRPFGDPAALPFFAARRELLRIPARPVNTFFTRPEEPLSLGPRRRFPSARRSVFTLARPARQRFFSIPPKFLRPPVGPGAVSRSGRGCLRGARAGVNGFLERRGVFPAPHRAARGCLP